MNHYSFPEGARYLWDFDNEPTHDELDKLYETAKKNQWNGSVMQDEGRHVNFGYFALRCAIPDMEAAKREYLEDFCFRACDLLYSRDERTGFQSIKTVWNEMGWDADKDAVQHRRCSLTTFVGSGNLPAQRSP